MASTEWLFSRKTAIWLAIAGGASLLFTLVLQPLQKDVAGSPTSGSDSFSRSAIGHRAFMRVLDEWGYDTLASRHASAEKVGAGDLLVLAEPQSGAAKSPVPLSRMIDSVTERGGVTLVVLPKWEGNPMEGKPAWIQSVSMRPVREPGRVLAAVLAQGFLTDCIGRGPVESAWRSKLAGVSGLHLVFPQFILHDCADLSSVVENDEGILIATSYDRDVVVIADPDLVNNAGLGKGSNALVVSQLFDRTLEPRNVVFDESAHGHGRPDSAWARFVEFPLVLVLFHLVGFLLVVVWAGWMRFGKPEPVPSRVGEGKQTLLDNTARLLHAGGHWGYSTKRYAAMIVREVAQVYGVPRDVGRLAGISRAQGFDEDVEGLIRAVRMLPDQGSEAGAALKLALRLHAWRFAMLGKHADRGSLTAGKREAGHG